MSVRRYRVQLYHWTSKRKSVELSLNPADDSILREQLEALVIEVTGKPNPDLTNWRIRVRALNGAKVCDCRVDPAGRTVVKR